MCTLRAPIRAPARIEAERICGKEATTMMSGRIEASALGSMIGAPRRASGVRAPLSTRRIRPRKDPRGGGGTTTPTKRCARVTRAITSCDMGLPLANPTTVSGATDVQVRIQRLIGKRKPLALRIRALINRITEARPIAQGHGSRTQRAALRQKVPGQRQFPAADLHWHV